MPGPTEPTHVAAATSRCPASELERHGLAATIGGLVAASTDFGNVSQAVPADYVSFPVSEGKVPGHSNAFRDASVTEYAHRQALLAVDVLAGAALRLAADPALRARLAR